MSIGVNNLDPRLLHALDALLSECNVTKAAQRLNISQSTMSGTLDRLRRQLDDPLLIRVGQRFQLTERGRGLLPRVRKVLIELRALSSDAVAFDPRDLEREFHIMASDFGVLFGLSETFRRCRQVAPKVRFRVTPTLHAVDTVHAAAVDLCMVGDMIEEVDAARASAISTRVFSRERYVAVVASANPIVSPLSLEAYMAAARVTVDFAGVAQSIEQLVIRYVELSSPSIRVSNFSVLGAIVEDSDYVALLPRRLAAHLSDRYALRFLDLGFSNSEVEFRMMWHTIYDRDPAHRWLRDLIVDAGRRPLAG